MCTRTTCYTWNVLTKYRSFVESFDGSKDENSWEMKDLSDEGKY